MFHHGNRCFHTVYDLGCKSVFLGEKLLTTILSRFLQKWKALKAAWDLCTVYSENSRERIAQKALLYLIVES